MLDSHSGEGIFRGEEGLKCKPFQVSSPHRGSWEMALHSRGAVQSGVFQASQNSQNLEDWMAIIFLYWIHVIQGRNRVFCFNSLLGHLLSRKGFLSLSEMSISLHWLFCDCVDSSQAFLEALGKADGASHILPTCSIATWDLPLKALKGPDASFSLFLEATWVPGSPFSLSTKITEAILY